MDTHSSSHSRKDIVTPVGKDVLSEEAISADLTTKLSFAKRKYAAVIVRALQDDDALEKYTSGAANMIRASEMLTNGAIKAVANSYH